MALSFYASRFLGMMVGAFVFCSMAALAYVIFNDSREPFQFGGVVVLTPRIHNGEPIRVVYSINRVRDCSTTIAEFWINAETGEAIARDTVPGGYAPLGPRQTPVTLRLPFPVKPGNYIYRSVMQSDCGLQHFTNPVPDVAFEVLG